jgi:hypothetical protein
MGSCNSRKRVSRRQLSRTILTGSRCLYRDVVTQALVPQQRNGSLGWLPRLRESVCGVLIVHEFSGLYHGNLYAYLDSFESKYTDTRGSRILLIEGVAGEFGGVQCRSYMYVLD